MINTIPNLFSDFADTFTTITDSLYGCDTTSAFKELANTAKDVKETVETALECVPANIYREEDGSKTIVVAIPGKTKENVTIREEFKKDGEVKRMITIVVKPTELTEEQKAAEGKRKVLFAKIKGMNGIKFSVPVESELDLDKLKANVTNGLLTITIPVCPEAAPRTFEIA